MGVEIAPGPAAELPRHLLSRPGDAVENEADTRAAHALGSQMPVGPSPESRSVDSIHQSPRHVRHTGPHLPPGTPPPIVARGNHGHPLAPGLAAQYERQLGSDLQHVRIHTDDAAARLADDAHARAFTIGSHVFFNADEFSPGTVAGDLLLTHELAHVVTAPPDQARLLRQPRGGTKTADKPQPKDPKAEHWQRLQVTASGLDDAARRLAEVGAVDKRNYVYIGLTSSFAKAYNTQGRPLGQKIPFKEDSKVSFSPGIYLPQRDGSLAAIEFEARNLHRQRLDVDEKGHGRSVVATRPLNKQEQKAVAEEQEKAAKEGRVPKRVTDTLSLRKLLTDPEKLEALIDSVPQHVLIYFVPEIQSAGGGKGGGEQATVYASPISGRGDGLPANNPPWPVSIEGPKIVPNDASPTYSAKVDWSANGNYSVAAQAFTQVGESIHYKWEYFNITKYARQQIAKDPANTKKQSIEQERTLEQNIEAFTTAKRGEGTDVTGTQAARREFRREFEDWWKDNRRAAQDAAHPHGETSAERLMNFEANRITLELAPVSLLITTIGAVAHFLADLFAGPRQQQEINLDQDGIYLIRVITTPAVHEDREGNPIIRPPSVAGHIVEVMPMDRAVQEALDDRAAQMAKLDLDITYAVKSGNKAKAEYLRDLKKRAEEQFTASPVTLLSRRLEEKEKELKQFKKDYPSLSAYSREREVGTLTAQIALYEANERDRIETFGKDVAPQAMTRVNATLISEVSAQAYPLLMTAGPVGGTGDKHRWMINDITQLDTGGAYTGELRDTPSAAFKAALEEFGRKAAYGRGMVGARTEGLPGMERGTPKDFKVESAPADSTLALKRIDDLVMTLAAVGLFVASAGTAGALIGAAAAATRLVQRWRAHKLSLDSPETVSDILGVIGGLAAGAGVLANLHMERMGKAFTVLEEGAASASKIESATAALQRAESLVKGVEAANELIGYAGVVWGNIQFADQMLAISAQENDPNSGMTHAAARRARADAMNAAIQNNLLFLAGNMLKYNAEAKAVTTAANEKASARKTPTVDRPAGGEKLPPGEHAPADTAPSPETPRSPSAGHKPAEKETDQRPADQKPLEKPPADKTHPQEAATQKEESNRETEEAKKTQNAEKAPVPDRRPTPEELINALPEDLRKLAVIDDTLHGDRVTIEWEPDESGLVGEIKIRISPDALPRTVALHEATVRTMQKYQGFLGRVRVALARITNMLGGEALNPSNKPLFDARLEVGKLPNLINEHLASMASMRGGALAEAEAKLDSLRNQLQEHMSKIEIGDLTPSSGVSARGTAKKDMAEYIRLLKKLQGLEPGSKAHEETRWKMYQLDHGELPPETWRKVYRANVERANRANEIVAAERIRLGWPEKEYTVPDLPGDARRLDLADPLRQKGAEVKAYTGETVWLSADVESEVSRDAKIVKLLGWEMTWIFVDCEPSGPLWSALQKAGITIELRTKSERSSRLLDRIPPPAKKK